MLKILIILLFLVVATQFIFVNFRLLQKPAQDFDYFYSAGKKVVNNENPYTHYKGGLIRNPPPTLILYVALSSLPIITSQYIWFILSFLSFLGGSYLLFLSLRQIDKSQLIKKFPLEYKLLYLTLVITFFPFRYNLSSGQLSNFIFLFIALSLYLTLNKNYFKSSLALALAILLKVTPAALLLTLLLLKKLKTIGFTLLNLVFISFFTLLILGLDVYRHYFRVTESYFDFGAAYYNQSLSAFLLRLNYSPSLTIILLMTILIMISAIILFLGLKAPQESSITYFILWNMGVLYLLIFPPFSWQHYYNLAIFPLLITFYLIVRLKFSYLLLSLLFLSYFLMGINIKNPSLFRTGITSSIILSHVLIGGLILLFLNLYLLKTLRLRGS